MLPAGAILSASLSVSKACLKLCNAADHCRRKNAGRSLGRSENDFVMAKRNKSQLAARVLTTSAGETNQDTSHSVEGEFNRISRGYVTPTDDISIHSSVECETKEQHLNAERFATLGQLLSGIAHDAGTPLNIISGYAEFLLMKLSPEDHGHKELSAIVTQTRRIASLFAEALDLARPPQGQREALDVGKLLSKALNLAGHFLRKADVRVTLTCEKVPPLIYGESSQVTQALFNLVLNAAQQVSPRGSIEVVVGESRDEAFVTVEFWASHFDGQGHDFGRSLVAPITSAESPGPPGIGMFLAREVLERAGAAISSGELGERGVPLVVSLPVGGGESKTPVLY